MPESGEQTPQPLHKKYPELYKSKEVKHATVRQGIREGRSLTQPAEMIGAYLADLEQVHVGQRDKKTGEIITPDPVKRERIKASYHKKHVITAQNVSDNYIRGVFLGSFAETKGYDRDKLSDPAIKQYVSELFEKEAGVDIEHYQIPQEEKDKVVKQTMEDQRATFDVWYDYLTSEEARAYPTAFKYWAFTEMTKMGGYDRVRKDFNKRSDNTIAPYPDLNRQALSLVLDEVVRKHFGEPSRLSFDEVQRQEFQTRLKGESFSKLYGWGIDYVNSLKLPEERLPITTGEWRTFARGTDPKELSSSLASFNTEWCIAGEGTAAAYLEHSDILVYFSEDDQGKDTIPRAAIVTDGDRITEVRGIMQKELAKQHLDDYIAPVVSKRLSELPGGQEWQSAMEDMRVLAEIHFKDNQGKPLSRDDLVFLYELDRPIHNMGYGKDPRIEKVRGERNPLKDAADIFGCDSDEIAKDESQINQNTKAFVGSLTPGIFNLVKQYNIEHIYTTFPEGKIKIRLESLTIGGKSPRELEEQLRVEGFNVSSVVKSIMERPDFSTQESPEDIDLVKLTAADLGLDRSPTTDQVYERAQQLGLELCPPEVGPHMRLAYKDQPYGEYLIIGMKQILASGGDPGVFSLGRGGDGLWLYSSWAHPGFEWSLGDEFVFRLGK